MKYTVSYSKLFYEKYYSWQKTDFKENIELIFKFISKNLRKKKKFILISTRYEICDICKKKLNKSTTIIIGKNHIKENKIMGKGISLCKECKNKVIFFIECNKDESKCEFINFKHMI